GFLVPGDHRVERLVGGALPVVGHLEGPVLDLVEGLGDAVPFPLDGRDGVRQRLQVDPEAAALAASPAVVRHGVLLRSPVCTALSARWTSVQVERGLPRTPAAGGTSSAGRPRRTSARNSWRGRCTRRRAPAWPRWTAASSPGPDSSLRRTSSPAR